MKESRSGLGPTDELLVRAAQAGERWALEALFRRYLPVAMRIAGRLLPSADADDVVQDAFVRAFKGLYTLETGEAFPGWLKSIVVRTALNRIRRSKVERVLGLRRGQSVDMERIVGAGATPHQHAELAMVYRVLERMSASERAAFVLREIEGMTVEEVAGTLELSVSTVKRRLNRVYDELNRVREGDGHRV